MDDIIKLIEDSKTYSNELKTEVLPVSVVRKIVQELYSSGSTKDSTRTL
jgi:hypothetical protein